MKIIAGIVKLIAVAITAFATGYGIFMGQFCGRMTEAWFAIRKAKKMVKAHA